MRMHFRPRLASYYKAGAVLGAIFDAALESRYRPHLRPSRSGFLVLGGTQRGVAPAHDTQVSRSSEVRRQRTTIFRLRERPS